MLFGSDLFPHVTDDIQKAMIDWLYIIQNSRHFNKIGGDFDLIRDPMYKYRKEVKEKLFKDNYMAFYWMYYRCFGEF